MDQGLSWYLTGGTALSRFYLNHRYSDDLDFFLNDDLQYKTKVETILRAFQGQNIGLVNKTFPGSEFFAHYILHYGGVDLKVDFVNDIPARQKLPIQKEGIWIDSIENITTNKISAIYRFAAKDIADLWSIAHRYQFSWLEAFEWATKKVMGIDLIGVGKLFFTIPASIKNEIKWNSEVKTDSFGKDLITIGQDILNGRMNSLAQESCPLLKFE